MAKYPIVNSILKSYTNEDLIEAYLAKEMEHWSEYTGKPFPENIPPWTLDYVMDVVDVALSGIPFFGYTIRTLITHEKDIQRLFDLFIMGVKLIKKIEHDDKTLESKDGQ